MSSDAPRLLLFGHPGSGKSSLLGALQQVGETQGERLGAEVIDPSGRLPHIRDHLYRGAPFENTHTELVSYEIRLRPWRIGSRVMQPPQTVVIHDCDGDAARALLRHPDPITERDVRGIVATAVVQADLIALVVNADSTDDELLDAFDEFIMFLERVHGRKAFEREVGGFPILLILTQCDLLAEPGMNLEYWEAETRERLDYALKRFGDFLEDQSPAAGIQSPFLPFGSVTLHGYAVAVRMPGGSEPFQVADCFREAFALANQHRDRRRQSQRTLKRTVWAAACTVLMLLVAGVAVTVYQPKTADPGLADRVQAYWEREPAAAQRLAGRNLARNRSQLTSFQADPGFFALSDDLRHFVSGRLHELDDYQAYWEKLAAAPIPAEARSLEELARIEAILNGELALPPQYTWGETEAAHLRDKWLADVPLIRGAESAWHEWYRGLVNQALALTHARGFDGDWRVRVAGLAEAAERRPFDAAAPIPGSESIAQPRGEAATYRVAAEFDRVYQAARDWEFTGSRLNHLRDFADALGLTSDPAHRILDLPPPGPGVDSTTLPGERLQAIRKHNGNPNALADWHVENFPEPGRTRLTARLRESLGNGAKHARGLIAAKLTADTPDGWRKLADSLNDPAIRDWGHLLRMMAALENTQAGDPVEELAAFLRTQEFTLEATGFELAIPLALRVPPVAPAGLLTLTATPATGKPNVRTFKMVGEATAEGLNVIYRFVPERAGALAFKPGEGLKLELPVRSGDQNFTLQWEEGANRTFPFDRMAREPKLTPTTGAAEPATGVTLQPFPGSKLPRLPLLLPDPRR